MVVVVSAWGGLFLITIPHFDYTDTHFSKESSSNLLEAPPAAFVQAGIGFFSFVNSWKWKKSFVNSWKRFRSWFVKTRNMVREFVKIETSVREFVNSKTFVIRDSWIDKIMFVISWNPPFFRRSWVRENEKNRSWICESRPPWGDLLNGSLSHPHTLFCMGISVWMTGWVSETGVKSPKQIWVSIELILPNQVNEGSSRFFEVRMFRRIFISTL